MIAAMDNTFLTLLLNPNAAPRPNPRTGEPTNHCKQRVEALIDSLSRAKGTLFVPAPALAEVLCTAELAETYLDKLQSFSAIEIASFDGRAAYELSRVIRYAVANGDKRSGQEGNWQHVKMDRAIVAIAVSRNVDVFYSDDQRQTSFAELAGLRVVPTWELPLPDEYTQQDLSERDEASWPRIKPPPKSSASAKPPEN